MKIRVVDPVSLTADEIALWNRFRAAQQSLASPYFSPKYFQAASKAIRNVQIAICEVNGEIAAFFPFQRRTLGIAKPVGGPFSDYHGVIARSGFRFDPRTLLKDCGLTAFDYDHLPADQIDFAGFSQNSATSQRMDLSESFEHYRLQRKAAGSGEIENTLKKQTKLTKEVGSVKFIQHDSDRETSKQARQAPWGRDGGMACHTTWGRRAHLKESGRGTKCETARMNGTRFDRDNVPYSQRCTRGSKR